MNKSERDVFICHASEDKSEIVRPLQDAFEKAGISCWVDEAEINWGDSIVEKVNEGLSISRFVIVVLSRVFTSKEWPQKEMNAALGQEARSGEVRVLPLIAGNADDEQQILRKFLLLQDRYHLSWDKGIEAIVTALLKRLGTLGNSKSGEVPATRRISDAEIPLPTIKKQFTDRDRDLFLKSAYVSVKDYFVAALHKLTINSVRVETDLVDVQPSKFMATVYVDGNLANRCKIWIGGLAASDSLVYQAGRSITESNNAFNDLLSVSDNGEVIGFETPFMQHGAMNLKEGLLSANEAAEYLWRRFTEEIM